jgi:hypothetical protein
MKTCIACHIEKDLSEFSKNKRMFDGLQQRCKVCCKHYRDDNKTKNQSQILSVQSLQCTKCEQVLDISFFSPKTNSPRGFDYWCKGCRNSYKQEYYADNLEDSRAYINDKRQDRIQWFWSLKEGKSCVDCAHIYEPYCMDYDHLGDKINSVSRMVLENASKKKILEEIDKCELVCCLCHNIRTQKRLDEKYPEKKHTPTMIRNIEIINKAKNIPCYKCNIQRELCNMQLDHIDPNDKFKNVSQLKSFNLKVLLDEINKCQVICALCHRRKSIWEQQDGKYPKRREKVFTIGTAFIDADNRLKECLRCHKVLSFDFFMANKNCKDECGSWCKECFNEYRRERRKRR